MYCGITLIKSSYIVNSGPLTHAHASPIRPDIHCHRPILSSTIFQNLIDYHHNQSLACQVNQTDPVSTTRVVDEKNHLFL